MAAPHHLSLGTPSLAQLAVAIPGVKPGDIYAIISYTWSYRQSLDLIPTLVQQLSRLQDIGDRMQTSPHLSPQSNW